MACTVNIEGQWKECILRNADEIILNITLISFCPGRQTAQDIAAFARSSAQTNVRVLGPSDFPGVANNNDPWFIDFFAPVSSFSILTKGKRVWICHCILYFCNKLVLMYFG